MQSVKGGTQIWIAFNYIPGGQIVAQHFEDLIGEKKQGDGSIEVRASAREQMEAFKKQPNVALNFKGVLKKNEVLIYDGPSLATNPHAGQVVTEWALQKGLEPIKASADQKGTDPKTYEYDKRIMSLEGRMDQQDQKLDKILEAVGQKK